MAAPAGNKFWMLRSKHGRDKLFSTPELLWEAACEYFQWCDENPWLSKKAIQKTVPVKRKKGKKVETVNEQQVQQEVSPTSRPYSLTGFCDTDMMVEYAKLMKEWDNIGVWKTDVLNNTASSNRDDYRIGRVAAEQHHTQTWTDLCSATPSNTIYQDDPDAESGFFYFGEETGNVVALSITHGAMAVSAASKNPERALMVYDLLRNDEECYRLLCYGIEGVSYEINDEGLRTTPEGYNSDTDNINGMTNWWWGRNDDLEIRDATRNWDAIDKLYSEYDSLKIDYPYGQFVPEVDDIQSKIDNINEVYTNYTKQISYGKYQGTAEEIVAEMQSALKQAGIEEVTAALQEQFDALYK